MSPNEAPAPATSPGIQTIDTGCDQLRAWTDAAVGHIVIDNPERHNAISGAMFAAFADAADALENDAQVRAVVLRGAGDRAFAAGADIGGLDERNSKPSGLPRLRELSKPVVAIIRGWCIGGGVMTALYADLRIAADDATFGIPAARLGVGYPYEATEMLVSAVGEYAARELLLLGERFGAARALELGLVHRVVPAAELDAQATELVDQLIANAPLSMAAAKASIAAVAGAGSPDAAQTAIAKTWGSRDFAEGRKSFAEKRAAVFEGH